MVLMHWSRTFPQEARVVTNLRSIICAQALWLVLALGYNLVSWWRIEQGLSALSPTDPVEGFFGVLLFLLPGIWLGLKGNIRWYSYLNWVFIAMVGSAAYRHVLPYFATGDYSSYASMLSWSVVFLLNSFGLVLGVLGSFQLIQHKQVTRKSIQQDP